MSGNSIFPTQSKWNFGVKKETLSPLTYPSTDNINCPPPPGLHIHRQYCKTRIFCINCRYYFALTDCVFVSDAHHTKITFIWIVWVLCIMNSNTEQNLQYLSIIVNTQGEHWKKSRTCYIIYKSWGKFCEGLENKWNNMSGTSVYTPTIKSKVSIGVL